MLLDLPMIKGTATFTSVTLPEVNVNNSQNNGAYTIAFTPDAGFRNLPEIDNTTQYGLVLTINDRTPQSADFAQGQGVILPQRFGSSPLLRSVRGVEIRPGDTYDVLVAPTNYRAPRPLGVRLTNSSNELRFDGWSNILEAIPVTPRQDASNEAAALILEGNILVQYYDNSDNAKYDVFKLRIAMLSDADVSITTESVLQTDDPASPTTLSGSYNSTTKRFSLTCNKSFPSYGGDLELRTVSFRPWDGSF